MDTCFKPKQISYHNQWISPRLRETVHGGHGNPPGLVASALQPLQCHVICFQPPHVACNSRVTHFLHQHHVDTLTMCPQHSAKVFWKTMPTPRSNQHLFSMFDGSFLWGFHRHGGHRSRVFKTLFKCTTVKPVAS